MSAHFANWDERTLDLAVDRFTVGLDREDEATLDRLAGAVELEEFEQVLAAVHLGHLGQLEAPPSNLFERLEQQGRVHVGARSDASDMLRPVSDSVPLKLLAVGGWLAAAALLLMFFIQGGEGGDDVSGRRATLLASAGDLVRVDWAASEDPAALGATGDVLWSSSLQEGYMRFQGLVPNDPAQNQYQLWIFDPTRANWEAKPVDGGVFDVPKSGEVIVPIDAKLAVSETALFAVTLEVPGGVVVSERERLVLTAAPEQG